MHRAVVVVAREGLPPEAVQEHLGVGHEDRHRVGDDGLVDEVLEVAHQERAGVEVPEADADLLDRLPRRQHEVPRRDRVTDDSRGHPEAAERAGFEACCALRVDLLGDRSRLDGALRLLVLGVEGEEQLGRGAHGAHPLAALALEARGALEEPRADVRRAEQDGREQVLLAGEVLVHGPFRDADGRRHALHRHSAGAAREEHGLRLVEDPRLAVADLLLLGGEGSGHGRGDLLTVRREMPVPMRGNPMQLGEARGVLSRAGRPKMRGT